MSDESIGNVEGVKADASIADSIAEDFPSALDLATARDLVKAAVGKPEKVRRGIDQRVAITLAVQKFKRAEEAFAIASRDWNEACTKLRAVLGGNERVVTRVDSKLYLVVSDAEGNFDVEALEEV